MQKSDFLQVKITMHGHATTRFSDNDMVLLCTQNPGRDVSEVTCSLHFQDSMCLGGTRQVVRFLAQVFQIKPPMHGACSICLLRSGHHGCTLGTNQKCCFLECCRNPHNKAAYEQHEVATAHTGLLTLLSSRRLHHPNLCCRNHQNRGK